MIDPTVRAQTKPQMQPLSPIARNTLYATLVLLVLALVFGGWGVWKVFGGADANRPTSAQLQAQQRKIDQLEQRAATLARPAAQALLAALKGAAYQKRVRALPGYGTDGMGEAVSVREVLLRTD